MRLERPGLEIQPRKAYREAAGWKGPRVEKMGWVIGMGMENGKWKISVCYISMWEMAEQISPCYLFDGINQM